MCSDALIANKLYSSDVWRAGSSPHREDLCKTCDERIEMLISLDSRVKILNKDCFFLHFMQYLAEIHFKIFDTQKPTCSKSNSIDVSKKLGTLRREL